MSAGDGRPAGMMTSVRNAISFVGEARRTFSTTGMLAPSSRFLARAMTLPLLPPPGRPRRVLEVGPGTGVMTRELIAALDPVDHLDVVEINPTFARAVRELFDAIDTSTSPSVRMHECAVQDAELDGPYDAVVCVLPFTNFPPQLATSILEQLVGLLAPGARMSIVGYVGTLKLRRLFSRPQADEHALSQQVVENYYAHLGTGATVVWRNFPPARVRYLTAPV